MLGGSRSPRGRARATPPLQLDPSRVDRTRRGSGTVLPDIRRLSIEGTRLFNSISESSLSHELGVVRGKHGLATIHGKTQWNVDGEHTPANARERLANLHHPPPRAFELRGAPVPILGTPARFPRARARVWQNLVHLCEWRCLR